ncbi:MAG: hypothetical protein ACWA5R_04130 [bacterium]
MIEQFRTSTLSNFLPQCRSSRDLARVFLLILCITTTASANQNEAIRSVLDSQLRHWNKGDIPAFMEGYLHSKELRFASGDHVDYGWETTLQRYQQHYPDKKQMGQLSFEPESVTPLRHRAQAFDSTAV